MALKDIVVSIIARLNPASAQAMSSEMQEALNDGTNPSQAVANLEEVESAVKQTGNTVSRFYQAFIAFTVGRAIYKFFEDSVAAFAKLDQKIQQSVAIMANVTDALRQRMTAQAVQISTELNISADDLAGAYYYLASAGLSAEASMKALPIVALFMKAGMMDAAKATELLTQANSVLGYRSVDAEKNLAGMVRVADVLTLASKRSMSTIEQFAEALATKSGNSLRLFGKDVEEGAAVLAVFANQGIRGAAAGERLDIFLRQASLAAIKHKDVFEKYGISIFDANGKMRDLADISDDLTKALGHLSGEGQVAALTQLGFNIRTVAAAKALIDQGQAIRDYERDLRSASGFTKDVAEKQLQTPIEQWGLLGKKITAIRIEIGGEFIDALDKATKKLGDPDDPRSLVGMLRMFSSWLDQNKESINVLGAIVTWLVVYPLEYFFGAMNKVADLLVINVGSGLALVSTGFTLLASVAFLTLKPIGMLLGWLTGGAFTALDTFADKLGEVTAAIADFGVESAKAAFAAGKDLLTHPIMGQFFKSYHAPDPLAGLSGAGSGRDTPGGTDNPPGDEDAKAIARRKELLERLSDELDAMLARHTKARADDEIAQLDKLIRAYAAAYTEGIPAEVMAGFEQIRQAIASEDLAAKAKAQFDVMKSTGVTSETMEAFTDRLKLQRDALAADSTAWADFNKLIEEASKLGVELKNSELSVELEKIRNGTNHKSMDIGSLVDIQKFIEQMKKARDETDKGSDAWKMYDKKFVDGQKLLSQRLQQIGAVGMQVAEHLIKSFTKFFDILTSGSRSGHDAFMALARGMAAAAVQGLGDFATKKSKQDFALSAEQVALGFAAAADPLTSGEAAAHFAAAAHLAEIGSLWAVLAGGAGAGAAGIASGGGHGNSSSGANAQVSNSIPKLPEINIYVDGVDPNNPTHQARIGQANARYVKRSGTQATITKGFP